MSAHSIKRYVVTFSHADHSLTDILELSSAMLNGGFTTSLNDDDGKSHELGPQSFGMVSAMSEDEVKAHAQGVAEVALKLKPDAQVVTLAKFIATTTDTSQR